MAIVAKNQDEIRSEHRAVCEEYGLVLMLGAGVSVNAGLPNWQELTKRILIHNAVYGPVDGAEKFVLLDEVGYRRETIISMAEDKILNEQRADRAEAQRLFASVVRESLYAEFAFWKRTSTSPRRPNS